MYSLNKHCTILVHAMIVAFLVAPVWAQLNYTVPYTFSRLSGASSMGSADGVGSAAQFNNPSGVVVDTAGNLFVADTSNHTIRKISPAGAVSTIAGSAGISGMVDGSGGEARFNAPTDIVMDTSGNLYVTDYFNSAIRKITPLGVVTTFAGKLGERAGNDGTGSSARFYYPKGMTIDSSGNLYVAEWSHRIRKITSAGVVTTLAGSFGVNGSVDGTGAAARFTYPDDVAVDGTGNVYVADTGSESIRKITPAGVVTTIAGQTNISGSADGIGPQALFYGPSGIVVDSFGSIYVSEIFNNALRRITTSLVVQTLSDPTNKSTPFSRPYGLGADTAGNVYVADTENCAIRKITAAGAISLVAGLIGNGHVDASGGEARFNDARAVAVDTSGNIYVADMANHVIRKITSAGVVTTLAGAPGVAGFANGLGSAAKFDSPQGIAVDAVGNVYVADTNNSRIRVITPAGLVATLAGGAFGSRDGTGSAAGFSLPRGVAVNSAGIVYVSDTGGKMIRKVTAAGVVTTLAGTSSFFGGSADGLGAAASFRQPNGIAVDDKGTIYVADGTNYLIRKISPEGAVTTLAGTASVVGLNDGVGSAAQFREPFSLAVDTAGTVFVTDPYNKVIRRITPEGMVSTIAGGGSGSGYADGAGSKARFYFPTGIAVSSAGKIYVTDGSVIRTATISLPEITTQPQNLSVVVGGSVQFLVTATNGTPLTYQWLYNGAPYSGGTSSTLSFSNARLTDAGEYSVMVTNSGGSITSNRATLTVTAAPPPPTPPSSGGGGGGGGAPSGWFLGALAMVALLRHGVRARGLF